MSAAVLACQLICGLLLIVASSGFSSTKRRHHPLGAPGRRSNTPSVSNIINNNQKVTQRLCSLRGAALLSPQPTTTPSATSSRRGSSSNDLPGVSDFERWFESTAIPRGAYADPNIQHAVVGRSGAVLRGLSWMGSTPVSTAKRSEWWRQFHPR